MPWDNNPTMVPYPLNLEVAKYKIKSSEDAVQYEGSGHK